MTHIRITRHGRQSELRTAMPWDQALDVLGRAFWPEGPHLGGPKLPPTEQPKPRRVR